MGSARGTEERCLCRLLCAEAGAKRRQRRTYSEVARLTVDGAIVLHVRYRGDEESARLVACLAEAELTKEGRAKAAEVKWVITERAYFWVGPAPQEEL